MRDQIIKDLRKYFKIEELVDKKTYDRHGTRSWKFFSTELLETLLFIRTEIGKSITVNNWHAGGKFQQRGLRTNLSMLVRKKSLSNRLYLSAHMMGKAVDFDVKGLHAEDVRDWIRLNEDKLPYKIRLEHKFNKTGKPITWIHLDVYDELHNPKVYLFNV